MTLGRTSAIYGWSPWENIEVNDHCGRCADCRGGYKRAAAGASHCALVHPGSCYCCVLFLEASGVLKGVLLNVGVLGVSWPGAPIDRINRE
jgi:hypothetical protein